MNDSLLGASPVNNILLKQYGLCSHLIGFFMGDGKHDVAQEA
jgi:hypothetical protein